jgi:hypothetical protein
MTNGMKIIRGWLVVAAVWLSCPVVWAQQTYPKDIYYDDPPIPVKFKGGSPGIKDFATAYFKSDIMPEIWGSACDAWKNYLRKTPQEKGSKILFDAKNGFIRYEFDANEAYGDGDEEKDYVEMCYWNCADGKYKIFATNCKCELNGKHVMTEYCGPDFYLYDNARHTMCRIASEGIGAYVSGESEGSNIPVVVYSLPRKGKNIGIIIQYDTRNEKKQLVWDGMRFRLNQE